MATGTGLQHHLARQCRFWNQGSERVVATVAEVKGCLDEAPDVRPRLTALLDALLIGPTKELLKELREVDLLLDRLVPETTLRNLVHTLVNASTLAFHGYERLAEELAGAPKELAEAVRSNAWNADVVRRLAAQKDRTVAAPPEVRALTRPERVLIVEDELCWREALERLVTSKLGVSGVATAASYMEAEAHIAAMKSRREARSQEPVDLAILDMHIPRQAGGKASRKWGEQLLGQLRDYHQNWNVIVLTTPGHRLEDQQQAFRQGVAAEDYVFKLEGRWEEEVACAINRVLEELARPHSLRILNHREIAIDNVPIDLGETYGATFRALAELGADGNHKPENIVDKARICFGGDVSCNTLKDHVYEIRAKIHEKMAVQGRTIHPDWLLRSVQGLDRTALYGLAMEARNLPPQEVAQQLRLLVVEDEPLYQELIAEAARQAGYESVVEDSVDKALGRLELEEFHLLCIDMMFPGAPRGGLEFLRQVRTQRRTQPAIFLSSLATDDELRSEMLCLNVRVTHVHSKSDIYLDEELSRTMTRIGQELRRGGLLPPYDAKRMHFVSLDSQAQVMDVGGRRLDFRRAERRFAFCLVLAETPNTVVSIEQLARRLGGTTQSLIQLKRQVWNKLKATGVEPKEVLCEQDGGYLLRGNIEIR